MIPKAGPKKYLSLHYEVEFSVSVGGFLRECIDPFFWGLNVDIFYSKTKASQGILYFGGFFIGLNNF